MLESSVEGLHAFDRALRGACLLIRPPDKLTVSQWADKYGRLSSKSSAAPGQWYTSAAEYQREPMDTLTDPTLESTVLMWASQVGKTAIALFLVAYFIDHEPAPILFVEPTLDIAKAVSKDRIDEMIKDTPKLAAIFGNTKARDSGNEILHKSFPGGQLTLAGANSPASLASRPVRVLITDEEGRYGQSAGDEGDPVKLAKKRTSTFHNRVILRVSSPNLRKTCSITKAFEASDQRHYFLPCPQCGELQTLTFPQLRWPPGKPADCYYVCIHNGCEIREQDKFSMVAQGVWRASAPGNGDGKTAGFHLNALYSTIGFTWTDIINDYLDSKDTPTKLQTFVNTVLAEPWDEQAEGADFGAIQKRAEPYPAPAPAWCVIVTCGADVQKDRIEATKWGWGVDHVSGALEHRVFRGDPTGPAVWRDFEEWRCEPVLHETGIPLPIACTFVDSGDGNRTQAVYEFTRRRERLRVYACKGSSLQGAPLVNRGNRVGKYKTILVSVGASTAKDTIFSRLQIDDRSAPGYIHFPSNPDAMCDADYFTQLTNEHLVTRETRNGPHSAWEAKGRNEALDCAVYAYAAKEFTRANLKLLATKLQRKAATIAPRPTSTFQTSSDVAKVESWAQKTGETAVKLAGALTPQNPVKTSRKPKRRIVRPGAAWING